MSVCVLRAHERNSPRGGRWKLLVLASAAFMFLTGCTKETVSAWNEADSVVVNDTPVWVLTGPGWERPPASLPRLKADKSPAIPDAVWKLVHIPKYQLTGAVWATNPPPGKNSPKAVYEFLSLDEFGQRTGLAPSLGMSAPQLGEQARRTPVESWMPQLFRGLPLRQVARP